MGGLWGVATIVGPLLFIAVLAFAIYRNRASSDRTHEAAEKSARDLREQLAAEREDSEKR